MSIHPNVTNNNVTTTTTNNNNINNDTNHTNTKHIDKTDRWSETLARVSQPSILRLVCYIIAYCSILYYSVM